MLRHLIHQGPQIATLGQTAARAALGHLRPPPAGQPQVPGPEIVETLPPRPADLVRDYAREVGGDPRSYRHRLPPHMFCQWGVPLAARTLWPLPYPAARALNGGCRLEINRALPADQPLRVSARLESIDDDGRRAVIVQRVATGIDGDPDRVVAYLFVIVPLGEGDKREGGKQRARVGQDADELAYWRISADAGKRFAFLTGDINPIHWSPRYARAFGFRRPILHGFATMARAYEGLIKNRFAGDTGAIKVFDVKFTRPLLLPNEVGLYLESGHRIAVGAAPGGPAYMTGSYQ